MGGFRAQEGGRVRSGAWEGGYWPQSQTQQALFISIIYTQEGKFPWSLGPPADKTHKDKRLGDLECMCVGGSSVAG